MNRKQELKIIINKLINEINNSMLTSSQVFSDLSNYKLFLENVELLKQYKKEYDSL